MGTDDPSAAARSYRLPGSMERIRDLVDRALERVVEGGLKGAPEAAAEAVRYAVLGEGKRVRPTLLVAGHRAAGGDELVPALFDLSCSVELVHAYSLIHDDLPCMDDDDLRRGRPALHVREGEAAAVYTGAALMPLAVRTVVHAADRLTLGQRRVGRLVAVLTGASGASGMVGGQLRDLEAEGRHPDRDELEAIYRGKTAALIAASAVMGGITAGASEGGLRSLAAYGRSLGLAFQVVDDVLDLTATERDLGKPSGRDLALDKATYPTLFGLEEARRRSRALAEEALEAVTGLPGAEDLRGLAEYVVERGR